MKTTMLTAMLMLSAVAAYSGETATIRDSSGRTTGTETTRANSDGTSGTTYRNSSGKTTETATERKNSDGSTTTTYRDAQGKTTGTKTERSSH